MKLLFATIIATMGLATGAQAQDNLFASAVMHDACRAAAKSATANLGSIEMMYAGVCMGVAMQTLRLGDKLDSANRFCAPDFLVVGQVLKLIVKGLDSPTNRVRDIRSLTLKMLREEWPCN